MIICVCNAVTESEIRACVELGCTDLDAVREAVGVASCCGTCADCAREVIDSCHARCHGQSLESAVEPGCAGFDGTPGQIRITSVSWQAAGS